MCAIFGFTRRTVSRALAVEGFMRTLSRGPDMSRFTECGPGWLGFHRLAIMGLNANGMQPFTLDGDMCVCNGELYGFRPLKTELVGMGYRFKSGSDCEILLPMYREYGTDMFAMLDAEFACIIYDSRKGASSPRATRWDTPLYYGELTAAACLRERAEEPRPGSAGDTPLPAGALLGWGVPPLRRADDGFGIQRRRRGGGGGA